MKDAGATWFGACSTHLGDFLASARQRRGLGPIFSRALLQQCSSKSAIHCGKKTRIQGIYVGPGYYRDGSPVTISGFNSGVHLNRIVCRYTI